MRLYAPAEIREFIYGKKDGKLNRIIKETGVNIELNMIGGDSMNVDLVAEDAMGVNFVLMLFYMRWGWLKVNSRWVDIPRPRSPSQADDRPRQQSHPKNHEEMGVCM